MQQSVDIANQYQDQSVENTDLIECPYNDSQGNKVSRSSYYDCPGPSYNDYDNDDNYYSSYNFDNSAGSEVQCADGSWRTPGTCPAQVYKASSQPVDDGNPYYTDYNFDPDESEY